MMADVTSKWQLLISKLRENIQDIYLLGLMFFKLAADDAIFLVEEDVRLDRFCRLYENFTNEECVNIEEHDFSYVKNTSLAHEENFDQVINAVSIPISLLVVIFVASWSDRHGRIPLFKLSIAGYFLAGFIYTLFAALDSWPSEVLIAAHILRSLAGGSSLFIMAVFSMTIDRSTVGNRSIKLGAITNMIIVGRATGFVSGLIVRRWADGDPFWVLFFALLLYVIATFIAVYLLKEDVADFEMRTPPRCRNSYVDLVHPKNIGDFFCVAFRRRTGRNRLHLLLILWVTSFVLLSPPQLMRDWVTSSLALDPLAYTLVSAASVIACQIVTVVFLQKTKKKPLNDCLLATIAEGMTAVQDMLLSSIIKPALSGILYFSMLFSITHNLSNVGIRAALSKMCNEGEIGRVFGIVALQEIFMSWVREVAFGSLYEITRETLPTSQHILSAFFAILNTVVLFVVYCSIRCVNKEEEDTEDSNSTIQSSLEDSHTYQSVVEKGVTIENEEGKLEGHDNMGFDTNTKF